MLPLLSSFPGVQAGGGAYRYILYAFGEMALVVIGILIALQINNWNEQRKERNIERDAYINLLDALQKDSFEIARILEIQSKSAEGHLIVFNSRAEQFLSSYDEEEILNIIKEILSGIQSFFPKYGTYNAILSNKGLDVLRSKEIKSKMIEYYDYQCKRYENIDAVVDRKFADDMQSYVIRELGFIIGSGNQIIMSGLQIRDRIQESYDELVIQCNITYNWLESGRELLKEMQLSVKELIYLIKIEMDSF